MDLINGLQTFIRVVETGSFSAVAREGNSSQSAVTRQVAQLEEHFGVRLFHRTTRKLSLTDDGQDLVTRARHLLEEAEDLEDTFGKNGGAPTGVVRIGLPVGAAILLVSSFTTLLRKHPGLSVELVVNEQLDDLVAERLDVALRFGQSADTSSVARALTTVASAPVAAPAYLERYGAPEHPSDLLNHTCIVQERGPDSTHWAFTGPEGLVEVAVASRSALEQQPGGAAGGLGGAWDRVAGRPADLDGDQSGAVTPFAAELYRSPPSGLHRLSIAPASGAANARCHRLLIEEFRQLEARLRDGREWGENDATWLV